MGAGIWAGFAGSIKDYVDTNRKYMQDKTERLENLILISGTKAVASAQGKVTDALSYKDYLIGRGMSIVSVNGIYDEAGFAGLKQTYDRVKSRGDLLPENMKEISNVYEDFYLGDEGSASNYITDKMNLALGLVPETNTDDTISDQNNSGFVGSMFGFDNRAYNETLYGVSPTTGLSGKQTLEAIGRFNTPNRGAGNAIDFSALPGKPFPLRESNDDLNLIGTAVDKRLQELVASINSNQLRENSTDITARDAFKAESDAYDAQQDALPDEQKSPYDTYIKYLTAQATSLNNLIKDVDPIQKIKDYLTMGIEAQRNVLVIFDSFDKQASIRGFRNRITENTVLPQEALNLYKEIPVFNSDAEVAAKQAQDPSFKNRWVKVNGTYKYLDPAS